MFYFRIPLKCDDTKLSHCPDFCKRMEFIDTDLKLQERINKGLHYMNHNSKIISSTNKEFTPWLQKTLSSCLNNNKDPECHDFSKNRENRKGSFDDIMMKKTAGRINLKEESPLLSPPILYPSAVSYFCSPSPDRS